MSIQRWDHIGGEGGAWAFESDTGPMVAYADHVAAMKELDRKWREIAGVDPADGVKP